MKQNPVFAVSGAAPPGSLPSVKYERLKSLVLAIMIKYKTQTYKSMPYIHQHIQLKTDWNLQQSVTGPALLALLSAPPQKRSALAVAVFAGFIAFWNRIKSVVQAAPNAEVAPATPVKRKAFPFCCIVHWVRQLVTDFCQIKDKY